ncbi:MAG: zinc-ribbon domain containing protein [Phycisphaerae bacterium]
MSQVGDSDARNEEPADEYKAYVEHPRFGRGPRLTGFNPAATGPFDAHWHSDPDVRIPNTAIRANGSKQRYAAGEGTAGRPIAYYFDVRRDCRDCGRRFIFFAEEQRFWYEELQLPLDVDCVRCASCRRKERGVARALRRYNELVARPQPIAKELCELVSLTLDLIDAGTFSAHPRTMSRVRMWLRRLSKAETHDEIRDELARRVTELEKRHSKEHGGS